MSPASQPKTAVASPPREAPRSPVAAGGGQIHATNNLKRLIDGLSGCARPRLLDIGRLCGQNIEWLVHRGFNVTVDDQLTTLKPVAPSEKAPATLNAPGGPLEALHYPPNGFDAILCWDLFDYLQMTQARAALARLGLFLKPRGLLLTLFDGHRPADRVPTRYRILREDQLEYETLPRTAISGRVYENREIQELFEEFDLLNSRFLKNQMREVLVQKKSV